MNKKVVIFVGLFSIFFGLSSFSFAESMYLKNPEKVNMGIQLDLPKSMYYLQDELENKYYLEGSDSSYTYTSTIELLFNKSLSVYSIESPNVALATLTAPGDTKYNNFNFNPNTNNLTQNIVSKRIYVTNAASVRKTWNDFYLYSYSSEDGTKPVDFPGYHLENSSLMSGKTVYYSDYIDSKYDTYIFSNGSSESSDKFLKTENLSILNESNPLYQLCSNKAGSWTTLSSAYSESESDGYTYYVAGVGGSWDKQGKYGLEYCDCSDSAQRQHLITLNLTTSDWIKITDFNTWLGYDHFSNDSSKNLFYRYNGGSGDNNFAPKENGTYSFYRKGNNLYASKQS